MFSSVNHKPLFLKVGPFAPPLPGSLRINEHEGRMKIDIIGTFGFNWPQFKANILKILQLFKGYIW